VSSSLLARYLAERIRTSGPLTFAEFMRECLYHPAWGYYSRQDAQRFADFYTSVDVHPIFGRLLARQLAEMWRLLGSPADFHVAEAGAGVGRLAAHILDFSARELPPFYESLRYVAVEQSAARRAAHSQALKAHLRTGHASSAAELPLAMPQGCVLSNELLDALPVHRVALVKGELREIYVTVKDAPASGETLDETFADAFGPLSTPKIEEYFREQCVALREGQQAEAGLDAARWIADAGRRLGRGFVLTVDYGHEAAELYNERHMRGTVLAYAQHRVSEDLLRSPGEQDLTAHVNFTALDLYGRTAGLQRTGSVSQMQFIVAMGRANEFADLYDPQATELERVRARLMLKTLINPEGMGETFQLFVQHKGMGADASSVPTLTGLAGI
jgi:SAM-dependent MidA family methyltransferase